MSDRSSGYPLCARAFTVPISQATSVSKLRSFHAESTSLTNAKTKPDPIRSVFKTPLHSRPTWIKSTYPFPSRPTQIPKTAPKPPKNMALHHGGTGPVKPRVNDRPRAASSTNPFLWRLPVSDTDETEIASTHPPKGRGADFTPFEASQPPPNSINNLTDLPTKLEEATDTALTAVVKNSSQTLVSWSLVLPTSTTKKINASIPIFLPYRMISLPS